MTFLQDVLDSTHTGWALPGLKGGLTLRGHAGAALEKFRNEVKDHKRGRTLRSAAGNRRRLAPNVKWLARQYVWDVIDKDAFANREQADVAAAVYRDALQSEIVGLLSEAAVNSPRLRRKWRAVLVQLGCPLGTPSEARP